MLYDTTFPQVLSTARAARLVDVAPSGGTGAAYGTTAGGRSVDVARAASLVTLALVVLVFAWAGRGSTSDVGVRLRFWHDDDWYRARYFVRLK